MVTCSPSELAEVVSWFTYENDRRLQNSAVLSRRLTQVRRMLWQIEEDVHAVEEQVELARTPETMPGFHSVILSWAHGLSLSAIMRQVDMVEGDILMLLNQTIDLLQQVQSAVGHVLDAKQFRANNVELFSENLTPSRRAKHHVRKQEQQVQASYAILSQLRPLLAQAVASLEHGLVLQSRTVPSMIAPIDEDILPIDEEEDVDPEVIQADIQEQENEPNL